MNKQIKNQILETTLEEWRGALERLYDSAYWQGYHDHQKQTGGQPQAPLVGTPWTGCTKCGLSTQMGTWGYVCPRSDCPTRISW